MKCSYNQHKRAFSCNVWISVESPCAKVCWTELMSLAKKKERVTWKAFHRDKWTKAKGRNSREPKGAGKTGDGRVFGTHCAVTSAITTFSVDSCIFTHLFGTTQNVCTKPQTNRDGDSSRANPNDVIPASQTRGVNQRALNFDTGLPKTSIKFWLKCWQYCWIFARAFFPYF